MNNEISTEIPLGFNLPKDKTENIIKVIGVGGGSIIIIADNGESYHLNYV